MVNLKFSDLYRAPEVNPINRKARAVPFFNPINMYGRVFFFSWFGFMIAFWAWYTFPPLLSVTIKADLGLTPAEIANSNIVSLCATLLVRVVAGPLCDQYGPRKVFGGILLLGALPVGLAPLVQNATGLYVSRFFIGILGGSFVPCQVWSTAFFDKNIVGTANALTGGFGNAGGGITYFIMPAVYDGIKRGGLDSGKAWRVTFVLPLAMVIITGVGLLTLCPDTPDGKWSDRQVHAPRNAAVANSAAVVDIPGGIADKAPSTTDRSDMEKDEKKHSPATPDYHSDTEATAGQTQTVIVEARGEVVNKPTLKESLHVCTSPQTVFLIVTYMCSFGGELAINSILGAYYLKNFPYLGQTGASNWAAMFGFLNFVTRPLGGVVGDLLYSFGGQNLWLKKGWITTCGLMTGCLLILIGQLDPHNHSTMMGLIALMAIFHEAGNGANFALVPHVHPSANGLVSGLTGGGGNLGGVIFAIIFRFMDNGTNYAKAFWVIGIMHIAMNLSVCWIKPLPKGQIGGR